MLFKFVIKIDSFCIASNTLLLPWRICLWFPKHKLYFLPGITFKHFSFRLAKMDNITYDEDVDYPKTSPMDILNVTTSLVSAIANIVIVYLILRHKLLRTRSNLYLANLSICNLAVMLLVPTSLNLFGITDDFSYECMCGWEESLYGILFGNSLFALIVLVNWYVVSYVKCSCAIRCKYSYFMVMFGAWILILCVSIASVLFCIQSLSYPLALACFIIAYIVMSLSTVVIHIIKWVKGRFYNQNPDSSVELIVVSAYFLCWMPNWLFMYAQFLLHYFLSSVIQNLTYFLGYSFGWLMFFLLFYYDKSFRLFVKKSLGCNVEEESNEENLDKEQNAVLL